MYIRKWLNKKGRAFLEVDMDSQGGYITFSDCNKYISLDFWYGDKKEKAEKLHKLDGIIDALSQARMLINGDIKE